MDGEEDDDEPRMQAAQFARFIEPSDQFREKLAVPARPLPSHSGY
jgi:hypothetical protein